MFVLYQTFHQLGCRPSFTFPFLAFLAAISFILTAGQGPTPQVTPTSTSTPGIYTSYDNPFCLAFSGSTCTTCAFTQDYYLYGNECSRFQNETSDYYETTPLQKILRVCDSQCDSNNCVTTAPDTGYCTGCKYSSNTSAFYAYNKPTGASNPDSHERCVTDCDHFGQYYEEVKTTVTVSNSTGGSGGAGGAGGAGGGGGGGTVTTTTYTGFCSDCPSSCETCSSNSLCIECTYTKQRYTGSSSADFSNEVFTNQLTATSCSSRNTRTTGTFQKAYYVTSETKSCTLTSCQGTSTSPYDDINLVFEHLLDSYLIGQKEEVTIEIYLMKYTSGGKTSDHFWKESSTLANHYNRVFERTAADVSIQPLTCSGSVTQSCYSTTEKASVILKSNKLSFFVTKTFSFKNIIVDASELIPNSNCYNNYKSSTTRCCADTGATFPTKANVTLLNGNSNDAQCSPSTSSDTSYLTVPWEKFSGTTDVWKKGPFAFFVMSFLRDFPKYVPTLTIDGCEFKNFWYHRYAYSFIYLDQRASKLTITDTKFQNFYFPMGLITNMQKLTQRNSFFTSDLISTKIADCETYNSSLSTCHSLTIQDSTFKESFFGDYAFSSTDSTIYANEGIVLSLQEFGGSILIQGNTFKNLASIKFSLVNNAGGSESISAICANPRASFSELYRTSLDRHMQIVIGHESWSKTPRTSSVLSLRNVTHGLTVYNNIFENNAAETGTGLFVHNFENTQSSPIVIEENTFNANFATEFGTAIAIIKYQRDYVTLACKGVYLSGNTFTDNLGCPYVKGTAIVSCMPEKPNVSDMSSAYENTQGSDLVAYMMSYFVSTNDAHSLKTAEQGKTSSRFTDMKVSETDDLTAEIFSKFVVDIASHKDTVNSTTHPIHGTQIDTNRVSSINNYFANNFALHSQLFLQGAYNTLVQENTFENNSIPIRQFLPKSLSTSITLFKKALNSSSYWTVAESTPLMIRMSNYIMIEDSSFTNNTQILTTSISLAFGSAITIDKHLGISNVSITNTSFNSNQGWTSSNLFKLVNDSLTPDISSLLELVFNPGLSGTLITYNYWEYMYGIKVYASDKIPSNANGFFDKRTSTPHLILDTCTFYNNVFNMSSNTPIGSSSSWAEDYRTAFVRRYTSPEGASLIQMPTSSYLNSYGTFVLYSNLIYSNCYFTSNTIKDQRTFINPYGFNSLTLEDSVFQSNNIVDESTTEYSLRTYLYSYLKDISLASFTVQNVTFKQNTGKIAYLEDDDSLDQTQFTTTYNITITDIQIENHNSSPDFLFHINRKQNLIMSSIYANNVKSSLGFMFFSTTRNNVEISTVEANTLTVGQAGCLYIASSESQISLSNFTCQNIVSQSSYHSNQISTTISTRNLVISLEDIPTSACFIFSEMDFFSVSKINCISATLKGLGSASPIALPTPKLETKGVCLYTSNVGQITLTDFKCTFASTASVISSLEKIYGVYFDTYTHIYITSSTFESNYVDNSMAFNGEKVYIADCTFHNNTASSDGATFQADSNIYLEINDTTFTNNTCKSCEGIVNLATGKMVMMNSTFKYNAANEGSGLYASLATVEITDSTFKWNTAVSYGSAISMELTTVTITGSTFEENTCQSGDGAAAFYEGTVKLYSNTFTKNKASTGARNLKVLDATELKVSQCTFTDDDSGTFSLIKGSLLFIRNTKGTVETSTFISGRGSTGGAVYLSFKKQTAFTIASSTFTDCQADTQGEGIYAQGIQDSTLTIEDSSFSCGSSTSKKNIYVVYCGELQCHLDNVTFSPTGDYDTGNQLYLYKGHSHSLSEVKFIANCEAYGNCDRSQSTALRLEEVVSATIADSSFVGGGDRLSSSIESLGGAVRLDFPPAKVKTTGGTYIFKNCSFSGNQGKNGGAIYAAGAMNITINGSSFDNNTANGHGGAIYWDTTSTSSNFVVIGQVSFTNNKAKTNGGGYYFTGRKIDVTGATLVMSGNQASYGANQASYAVYVQLLQNPNSSIYSTYVDNKKTELNIARLLTSESSNRMLSTTAASGEYLDPPMVLQVFDEFGQQVTTDSSSTVEVHAIDAFGANATVDGNPFTAQNGYFILYPLAAYALPGTGVTFSFNLTSFIPANLGRTVTEFTGLYTPSNQTTTFRECIKGERRSDSNVCTACESTKYTLVYNSTDQCKSCPTGGICQGYDIFGPDVNYFKLSYLTNTVIECLNEEACKGAVVDSSETVNLYCAEVREEDATFCYTGWCEVGYTGNLCSECQDGYAYKNTDTKTCVTCTNNPSYYVIAVLVGIAGAIYMVIMVRSAIKEPPEEDNGKKKGGEKLKIDKEAKFTLNRYYSGLEAARKDDLRMAKTLTIKKRVNSASEKGFMVPGEASAQIKKEDHGEISIPAIYLKILTDYIQLVSIIGTFSFEWPDEITGLFSSGEKFQKSTSDVFSIDCLLRQPAFTDLGLSSFYSKLLIMALSPIGFGIVIVLVWYLVYAIKYKCSIKSHKQRLHINIITSLVVVIFILHPTITELSTQSFKCTQLGDADDDLYLDGNLEVKCWQASHLKWAFLIGLPSLIIWGLGIPFATLFLLKSRKDELHLETMKAKFGFLYEGYFPRAYYWEFIVFYRKMILIVISVFMSSYSTVIQGAIVIGVSIINYILQIRVKPYLTESLNEMEKRSLIASALTIYSGLFYLTNGLGSFIKVFFFILILIANIYFFLYFAIQFTKAKTEELLKNKFIEKFFGRCLRWIIKFEFTRRSSKIVPTNRKENKIRPIQLEDKEYNSQLIALSVGTPSGSSSISMTPLREHNNIKNKLYKQSSKYQTFEYYRYSVNFDEKKPRLRSGSDAIGHHSEPHSHPSLRIYDEDDDDGHHQKLLQVSPNGIMQIVIPEANEKIDQEEERSMITTQGKDSPRNLFMVSCDQSKDENDMEDKLKTQIKIRKARESCVHDHENVKSVEFLNFEDSNNLLFEVMTPKVTENIKKTSVEEALVIPEKVEEEVETTRKKEDDLPLLKVKPEQEENEKNEILTRESGKGETVQFENFDRKEDEKFSLLLVRKEHKDQIDLTHKAEKSLKPNSSVSEIQKDIKRETEGIFAIESDHTKGNSSPINLSDKPNLIELTLEKTISPIYGPKRRLTRKKDQKL